MPHRGCPCLCSFCNQNSITGSAKAPEPEDVYRAVSRAGEITGEKDIQIAFFGGSFTAIEPEYMLSLLKAGKEMLDKYGLGGIRISTRPDCIDKDILAVLKSYGVTAIELGAQSMCEEVLLANRRGHTAEDVEAASMLIKEAGFELGLQMMTGLYMDSPDRSRRTAEKLIALKPDTVRIYPTLIMENTLLEELWEKGKYEAQSLDEAVELCADLLVRFENAGIKVIRLGLHDGEEMKKGALAGPYHPAFRELCLSRIFLERFLNRLPQLDNKPGISYNIRVSSKSLSAAIGQKRSNISALAARGYKVKIMGDQALAPGEILIEEIRT